MISGFYGVKKKFWNTVLLVENTINEFTCECDIKNLTDLLCRVDIVKDIHVFIDTVLRLLKSEFTLVRYCRFYLKRKRKHQNLMVRFLKINMIITNS